jgi:hypothetical protein
MKFAILVLMLRMVPSVSVTLSKHVSASLRRSGTHACTDNEVWRNASALISGVRLSKGRKANLDSSRSASVYLPILVSL